MLYVKPLINSYCDMKILKSRCAVLNFDPNHIGSQWKVFIGGFSEWEMRGFTKPAGSRI